MSDAVAVAAVVAAVVVLFRWSGIPPSIILINKSLRRERAMGPRPSCAKCKVQRVDEGVLQCYSGGSARGSVLRDE